MRILRLTEMDKVEEKLKRKTNLDWHHLSLHHIPVGNFPDFRVAQCMRSWSRLQLTGRALFKFLQRTSRNSTRINKLIIHERRLRNFLIQHTIISWRARGEKEKLRLRLMRADCKPNTLSRWQKLMTQVVLRGELIAIVWMVWSARKYLLRSRNVCVWWESSMDKYEKVANLSEAILHT